MIHVHIHHHEAKPERYSRHAGRFRAEPERWLVRIEDGATAIDIPCRDLAGCCFLAAAIRQTSPEGTTTIHETPLEW